mmetsp:Transcript_6104/g.13892  ORF Transcript_6104/g.13892 Transcript_6104/m.13892 type:complete len:432 (-) Transcript_6104:163-1458(-)
MLTVSVCLDAANDLSIDVEVPKGATVARVKQELSRQDPTGATTAESIHLCAAARPGILLDDALVIRPDLGRLVLRPTEGASMSSESTEVKAPTRHMSSKELKQRLRELKVDFSGCSEKSELQELLESAEGEANPAAVVVCGPPASASGSGPADNALPMAGSLPRASGPSAAAALGRPKPAPQQARSPAANGARGPVSEEPLIQEVGASCDPNDDGAGADVKEIQNLARGGALGPGRLLFRGHDFWQELLPEHVTRAGLEFHVALDTGRNLARKPSKRHDRKPEALVEDDPAYLAAARCIPNSEPSQEDEAEMEKAVKAACSWGNRTRLRRLLVSCFVPSRCCSGALCEAAGRGHEEIVSELLRAGVAASSRDAGKTALHFACEQGHEGVARQLLDAKADLRATDSSGRTPCELAREQDLGMLAKRLEKTFL